MTVYTEGVTTTNNGSAISAVFRTAEIFPSRAGANGAATIGAAQVMHDASTGTAHFNLYFDRSDFPRPIQMDLSDRDTVDIGVNRRVNSFSIQISGAFTDSPGFHWCDWDITNDSELGGSKGA